MIDRPTRQYRSADRRVIMRHLAHVVLVSAWILVPQPSTAQVIFAPDPTPRTTVDGSGVIVTQPDQALVSLGVYVIDRDLQKAKLASDGAIDRLLTIATELLLPKEFTSTSSLSIEPKYSEEASPQFLGYEVSRSMDVTLADLTKLDALIDHAIRAGANRDFSISLRSSREKELKEEALVLAAKDARHQAEKIASALGAKVGDVRTIGSGSRTSTAAMASTVSFGRGTFRPGSIRVEASLSITFLLVP